MGSSRSRLRVPGVATRCYGAGPEFLSRRNGGREYARGAEPAEQDAVDVNHMKA